MALMKGSQIPKDAVVLNEIEATGYIWDVISKWDSLKETWALRYGPMVLGAINSISGIMINRHYRWRFKLGSYGHFSSGIPLVVMPGLLTIAFHKHIIGTDMLLMKSDLCPICYEVKSTALQMSLGLLYPMILAPTSALMLANRYSTYRVPHLFEGPKVMLGFLKKHTKSFTGTLSYIALIQMAASAFITYFEMKNTLSLRHKMLEMEKEYEKEKQK
ncbi:uncharacterized protein LOC123655916 [Melitaea cinxia]|uniref:uncharacterized protein LOC123655916 n=1 Tax=Melitaea cinxia TaxID=113334 RepID=UPI001E26F633|nr:uncharacterized protein LOC123655916 [Melitaea cinxia]